MSQQGPPPESMRVAANHGCFVAVRVRRPQEDVASRVKDLLSAMGLKPADKIRPGRRTSFRQDPSPMNEVVVFPARGSWVIVVPGSHDEELVAVMAGRLSSRWEAVAITWHQATDYHRIHRFTDGRLTRHVGVYAGDLIRSVGERLPGERWDEDDFRSRLLDAPAELNDWLVGQGIEPGQDRTGVAPGEDPMKVIRISGRLGRSEILRLYLDEVDGEHSAAIEEAEAIG